MLTCLSFAAVILLYNKYNNGIIFFPNDEAATARIEIMAKGNFSPEETAAYVSEVVQIIDENPYIKNYVANTTSRDRIWLFDSTPTDLIGRIWLDLIDTKDRPNSNAVFEKIQSELSTLHGFEARVSANTYSSSIVGTKDIEIEVSSADKRLLNQVAKRVSSKLKLHTSLRYDAKADFLINFFSFSGIEVFVIANLVPIIVSSRAVSHCLNSISWLLK